MSGDPIPGLYIHYKGGKYRLLFVAVLDDAVLSAPGAKAAVYVSLKHGTVKVRPLHGDDGWLTTVFVDGLHVERFTYEDVQP